jgi:hypothetical protein
LQGLRRSRTLKEEEVILRTGNEAKVAAVVVGSFNLHMPTGKTIVSNNCYFVLSYVRNIVSVSMLDLVWFSFIIKNNECSILRNNVLYGSGTLNNSLCVCDIEHSRMNVQNGIVSERRNRTLLDMVRSMMSYVDLPVSLWGYASETSAYLLNKVPSESVP